MESIPCSAFVAVQYFSLNACVEVCRKRHFVSNKAIMLAKQQKLGVFL
jgi:hypothetical protein